MMTLPQIEAEIVDTVHNTIDMCGNVNHAVSTILTDHGITLPVEHDVIQAVIYDATLSWGKIK